jgi:hypothetical protein
MTNRKTLRKRGNMRTRTLRTLAGIGAALLVSLVLAAPAVADAGDNRHPSGKDRSVENGGSGNQGNSSSDPDGNDNGGADKPNGSGGTDKADQDGNNGCGNDDDFEDDNNGNCGPKDKKKGGPCVETQGNSQGKGKSKGKSHKCDEVLPSNFNGGTPCTEVMPDGSVCGESTGGNVSAPTEDKVLGDLIGANPAPDEVLAGLVNNGDDIAAERESSGATLPFTGASIAIILAIGLGLVAAGFIFMRFVRPTHN